MESGVLRHACRLAPMSITVKSHTSWFPGLQTKTNLSLRLNALSLRLNAKVREIKSKFVFIGTGRISTGRGDVAVIAKSGIPEADLHGGFDRLEGSGHR
ncbi:MAG: hypothetical protein ACR5K7_01930 [Symbiopectobacterium sp.]